MLLFLVFLCGFTVSGGENITDNPPIIPVSPNVRQVHKHQRVVIDCSFTSTNNSGNITHMWTKDGTDIVTNRRVSIATNGSLIIERFLNKKEKSRVDSGLYECYATDSYGTLIVRQVDVRVYGTRPKLIIDPERINVVVGGVARIQCRLETEPSNPPVYIWEHPKLNSGINRMYVSHTMGVFQLYNVTAADEGRYKCTYLTNDENNTDNDLEKNAYLSVLSGQTSGIPKLLNTPTHITVPLENPALLECLVQGGTNVKISWLYENGSHVVISDRVKLSGKSNLHFSKTFITDRSQYRCVVENSDGFKKTRDYFLEVTTPPQFITTPQSCTIALSGLTRLNCLAVGYPEPTVQWYKDGLKLYPLPGMELSSQVVLYGLHEDSGYYQCITNNSMGIRIATASVKVTSKDDVPEMATNVTAKPISASEVNVTWSRVASQDEMKITACFVDYRIVHDIQCPGRCKFYTKSERDVVSKATHLVIKELDSFTEYRFAVQCFSASGAGMMSEAVTARTLESVPTAVPDVKVKPDSSTSFRVSWTEIAESERHGIISKYMLSYGKMDSVYTVRHLKADTRQYLVTGLDPNSTYIVKVLAGNSAGYPEVDNNWITYRTPISYQDDNHITTLKLVSINASAVSINWAPPEDRFVGQYRILVYGLLDNGPVMEFDVPSDKTNFTVSGLERREFYQIEFMVKDRDNKVRGYVTELYQSNNPTDLVQPPPPFLLNTISSSSSTISLSWEAPKTSLKIVGYTVRYQHASNDPNVYQEYINSTTTYATLRNLRPFTWYAFAVRSHSVKTEGPYCKPVIVQTKEGLPSPPENLLGIVVSPGTVKLKWGPPREQNGIITYYIIYYNHEKNVPDRAWSSIHQNASTTSVILEDLKNRVYYFKLKACTNAGEGTSSNVIRIENLDCDKSPKFIDTDGDCQNKKIVPEIVPEDDNRNIFEQRLGIIIGCGVGAVCVAISVTYVLFKQRQMRARYLNRPRTELVARYQASVTAGHSVADGVPQQEPAACSPMLRRMLENTDFTYKSEVELKALLSPCSSGSVNNQTGSTNTDSEDTTPGSSDIDLTYQQINDNVS